jgi:hypothetical protein
MNQIPMHPKLLSDQQKDESIIHLDELVRLMLAADAKLLTILDPAGLPNDLGAQVRKYAEAQRELVNASRAELERICAPAPGQLQ